MDAYILTGIALVLIAIVGIGFAVHECLEDDRDSEAWHRGFHHGYTRQNPDWPFVVTLSKDGSANYFAGRRAGWNKRVVELLEQRTAINTTKGDAA